MALLKGIPVELQQDRYWGSFLHLFVNCSKLKMYFRPEFVDIENCDVHGDALLKIAGPWSPSEKFMLNLALHLFNERYVVNLSDMDGLDPSNKRIALDAIKRRFLN
jgi:hypothetical protein